MADEDVDLHTNFEVGFTGIPDSLTAQITIQEIVLGESLLTPGLQTSVRVHSSIHEIPVKSLDDFKDTIMRIVIDKPILQLNDIQRELEVAQTTYRLDQRRLINNNTEEFMIHACDQSLLDDAATLVSKHWKCKTPSTVVEDVLSTCLGVHTKDIEPSYPGRDYIAENIRPFQIIAQQSNVALANGNDPSFIHYMTYENLGTHKFKSLYDLTRKKSVATYVFQETGANSGQHFPYSILTHSFPCDFDLLSDLLNGVGTDGQNLNTLFTFNPIMKMFNKFGSNTFGCGIGSGLPKLTMSNEGSAKQQGACPDYAKMFVHKRQARMTLLEQDKIALRITVPWIPTLNVGKIIKLEIPNKADGTGQTMNYGSGDYLIVSLKHHIKRRQPATITMDCVSRTVGGGLV